MEAYHCVHIYIHEISYIHASVHAFPHTYKFTHTHACIAGKDANPEPQTRISTPQRSRLSAGPPRQSASEEFGVVADVLLAESVSLDLLRLKDSLLFSYGLLLLQPFGNRE